MYASNKWHVHMKKEKRTDAGTTPSVYRREGCEIITFVQKTGFIIIIIYPCRIIRHRPSGGRLLQGETSLEEEAHG